MAEDVNKSMVSQATDPLLPDRDPIDWPNPLSLAGFASECRVYIGRGSHRLEVVEITCDRAPNAGDVRALWANRWNRRAVPVLLVVRYPAGQGEGIKASVCGPGGPNPIAIRGLDINLVAQIADAGLDEPTHHAAIRFLTQALERADQMIPGLRNEGLFATNELENGLPAGNGWKAACDRGRKSLPFRGRRLVESLGFTVETFELNTAVLRTTQSTAPPDSSSGPTNTAVAIFCNEAEAFDAPAARFGVSPVSHAMAVAHRNRIRWVILTRASEIRLYAADPGTGVGGRGPTETYVEANLSLMSDDQAGYLELLFSARALADGGSVETSLEQSERFSNELAGRLRERIYSEAVPALAAALGSRAGPEPGRGELDSIFAQAMVIIFRLLFVDYAEDRDLLPYRTNFEYKTHSLTSIAQRLVDDAKNNKTEYGTSNDLWIDVNQIWRAVAGGNSDWGVPAYDGGLFSSDTGRNPIGAAIAEISLTNSEFAPALRSILVDEGPEGFGLVDFRSLSAREFGTIYEGLLESNLSVAPFDLCVQRRGKNVGMYRPVHAVSDEIVVRKGEIYLQNRLGIRKATGTYFTKPFAVNHILDHALNRALDQHIERLEEFRQSGDDAGLAKAFFDLRCADIAMGSGHFLVAAIDRIEARLSAYLAEHPIAAVSNELGRLNSVARDALGPAAASVEIETAALLRRQIARHCVYGVDVNPIAVDLARVAIWVHTFVPGLPLSFLDHNFVCGNSLTGVGTMADIEEAFSLGERESVGETLFATHARRQIEAAESDLERLGITSDATRAEVEEAVAAHNAAMKAIKPAKKIFDLITANRAGACSLPLTLDDSEIEHLWGRPEVQLVLEQFRPIHFPAVFPEVFLRGKHSGFDCLVGNPPWDKLVVNREIWWGRLLPGVRSLPTAQKRAQVDQLANERPDLVNEYENARSSTEAYKRLIRISFSLGAGDTDLYKSFAWANLNVARAGGQVGLILPRSAISDAGMAGWRKSLIDHIGKAPPLGKTPLLSIATLINHKGWVFPGVHNSYTVALVAITRSSPWQRASMPVNGCSTGSTGDTQSLLSRSARPIHAQLQGGGFDEAQPCIEIYPGPANSLERFRELIEEGPEPVPITEFASWSDTAAFPQIPSLPAFRVWRKMKLHPRFDGADRETAAGGGYDDNGGSAQSASSTRRKIEDCS